MGSDVCGLRPVPKLTQLDGVGLLYCHCIVQVPVPLMGVAVSCTVPLGQITALSTLIDIAGSDCTDTVVVELAVQLLASVTATVYMPALTNCILVILGF